MWHVGKKCACSWVGTRTPIEPRCRVFHGDVRCFTRERHPSGQRERGLDDGEVRRVTSGVDVVTPSGVVIGIVPSGMVTPIATAGPSAEYFTATWGALVEHTVLRSGEGERLDDDEVRRRVSSDDVIMLSSMVTPLATANSVAGCLVATPGASVGSVVPRDTRRTDSTR